MSLTSAISLKPSLFLAIALLILGLSCGIQAKSSDLPNQDHQRQLAFQTYDFNHDKHLNQSEFTAFFLSLFGADEKPFVSKKITPKLFAYLDLDADGQINEEEFRKAFQRWLLPIIHTKSCLFLCVPNDTANLDDLEHQTTQLIEQSKDLFKVHYVYVSSCHPEPNKLQTEQLVEHVKKVLPQAYDIKVYDVDSHLKSLKNTDFDQIIIHFGNIKHDRKALTELMSHNSINQHPTAIVADQSERQQLGHYLDNQQLHHAIIVNPSLSAQERARYKTNLALILARKIYRKYKKLIH